VEREPTTQQIIAQVDMLKPQRVFLDAMTQFRYLASDAFQFRKQALSFLRFLIEQGATVLFTSEGSHEAPDDDLQFMADGVIHLDFAAEGRTLGVSKFRGSDFRSGLHGMKLSATGAEVFPRLLPEIYQQKFVAEALPSGVPELDELLHGGFERGTISIISGPTGVGKTTLGLQFMKEAAGRGERSVVYTFEERIGTLLHRAEAVHIPVHAMTERGTLSVVQVEPLQWTPVLLISEVETITGEFRATEAGISYLADNIVFLRYLEIQGEIHRAIGVLKKRLSSFEPTLREIEITRYGIKVGKPLTELRGILRGMPEWVDAPRSNGGRDEGHIYDPGRRP
jgi:circadian clock protein KaiC